MKYVYIVKFGTDGDYGYQAMILDSKEAAQAFIMREHPGMKLIEPERNLYSCFDGSRTRWARIDTWPVRTLTDVRGTA